MATLLFVVVMPSDACTTTVSGDDATSASCGVPVMRHVRPGPGPSATVAHDAVDATPLVHVSVCATKATSTSASLKVKSLTIAEPSFTEVTLGAPSTGASLMLVTSVIVMILVSV